MSIFSRKNPDIYMGIVVIIMLFWKNIYELVVESEVFLFSMKDAKVHSRIQKNENASNKKEGLRWVREKVSGGFKIEAKEGWQYEEWRSDSNVKQNLFIVESYFNIHLHISIRSNYNRLLWNYELCGWESH